MPPGATHFIYVTSIVVILHVVPKAVAAAHPDNALSKAVLAILG